MTDKDFSGTPLYKKLGIKTGSRVAVVNEPEGFLDSFEIPPGAQMFERATEALDVILFFSESKSHLRRRFEPLLKFLDKAGGFWVAYPKKSSLIQSDLTFDFVQQYGLEAGLVDNKSCAIDEEWTGLRFVYRLVDR